MAAQCTKCQKPLDAADESSGAAICAACRAAEPEKPTNVATASLADPETVADKPVTKTEEKSDAAAAKPATTETKPDKDKKIAAAKAAPGKPAFWVSDEDSATGDKARRPLPRPQPGADSPRTARTPFAAALQRSKTAGQGLKAATGKPAGQAATPGPSPAALLPDSESNSTITDLRTILDSVSEEPDRRVDEDLIRLQASFFPSGPPVAAPPASEPAVKPDAAPPQSAADAPADGPCPHCGAIRGAAAPKPEPPPKDADRDAVASDAHAAAFAGPVARAVDDAIERLPPPARDFAVKARKDPRTPWIIAGGSLFVALVAVLWPHSTPPLSLNETTAFVAARVAGYGATAAAEQEGTTTPIKLDADAPGDAPAATGTPSRARANAASAADNRPAVAAAASTAAPADDTPPATASGHGFDRATAMSSMSSAGSKAAGCHKTGDPKGSARVTVTFGNSGHAKDASVAPPFAGTKTGACVVAAFKGISVSPFDGAPVSASKTVALH